MSLLITETSAPRPGRRFLPGPELKLEAEALQVAAALAASSQHVHVVREMSGPVGIPDFVVGLTGERWLEERRALDVAPVLNEIDAAILSTLSARRVLGAEAIGKRLLWPSDTIARRLPGLVKTGAAVPAGTGFMRPEALQPVRQLFAIENKLRDWRKALRQAEIYSTWAAGCVVVYDSLSEQGLHEVKLANRTRGVGAWMNGRWIAKSRLRKLSAARRFLASEHLFASLI